MKNLKMFQAALVIAVLSIVVGCSDQFTSPNQEFVKSSNKGASPEGTDQQVNAPFHTQVRIKPGRSYKFDLSNTGLNSIATLDVSRVISPTSEAGKYFDPCSGISIFGSIKQILGCHSSGLKEKEIIVQNTTDSFLDLDVILSGTKKEVVYIENN